MTDFGNQAPHGAFIDEGVLLPPPGFETERVAALDPLPHGAGHITVVPSLAIPEFTVTTPAVSFTEHGYLLPVVDAVALKIWQNPAKLVHDSGVLGAVKATLDRRLSVREKHDFFGLLATHPNVTPLESGDFGASEAQEFTPWSEGFWDSVFSKRPGTTGRPMTPGQITAAVQELNGDPDFQAAKRAANRVANPRRRRQSGQRPNSTDS